MSFNPTFHDLNNQLSELERRGNIKEALNLSKLITDKFPKRIDSWLKASQLLASVGNYKMSVHCLLNANKIEPKNSYVISLLALGHAKNGAMALAIDTVNSLQVELIDDAETLSVLGNVCSLCEEQKLAFDMFEKASKLNPDSSEHKYNLANSYRFLGDAKEAERLFDEVLLQNKADGDAILTRSRLRKQTLENNHTEWLLKQLESSDVKGELKTSIQYALAKEFEDLEQAEKSFYNLSQASARRRSSMKYDVMSDIESINYMIDTFSKDGATTSDSKCENSEAIFIVGLPRSGTTLTERILDSHSKIKSAGELRNFSNQINKLLEVPPAPSGRTNYMELAHKIDPKSLGQSYIESTRPRTGHTPYFIDKMPQNYINIGLIIRSLPEAKIVVLERNPMDSCYALFKAYFKTGVRFSYDLNDLANYYLAYKRLMDFWKALYPDRLHIVSYEKMVSETEKQARALIDYCGLAWEEQCLEFHKNRSPSSTASTSQVRQPIYTSSLNRWLKYREQLKPLEKALLDGGVDIGL